LPPEALLYYHNHYVTAHQETDLDTHLRVTLFAQTTYVGFGAQDQDFHTPFFDKIRRYVGLFKELTKPILSAGARVYHHTPDIGVRNPAKWCVLEYAHPEATVGYVGVFRLGDTGPLSGGSEEEDTYLLRPRGIDAGREYEIELDNSGARWRVSGAELSNEGLAIRVGQKNTSELVIYRVVE
jgi:hypothetical protein